MAADELTYELVFVIFAIEEEVALRVKVRESQLFDLLDNGSYTQKMFAGLMAEACKEHELDLKDCVGQVVFPVEWSIREGVRFGLSGDLFKPRMGMHATDRTSGQYLLH